MKTSLFLSILVHSLLVQSHDEGKPQIPQDWIYTMISFGFIGFVLILCIIAFASHKTRQIPRKDRSIHTKRLTTLIFTIWLCNGIACSIWALCRTDLFITLSPNKCTFIYIENYLFYMFAKYALHITLIYRLYIAFKGSQFQLQIRTLRVLLSLISINFLIFTSLWLKTCIEMVTIGITVPDHVLNVCTLFNNDSNADMDTFHKIWPSLLGAQDCIVGIITLMLFIYKMYRVSINTKHIDHGMQLIIRRLLICGVFAICSTFVFYTFAIPFYGNLTFLLPLDALINSFCVLLMMSYGKHIYGRVCCGCDWCLQKVLKHEVKQDMKVMVSVHTIDTVDSVVTSQNQSVQTI